MPDIRCDNFGHEYEVRGKTWDAAGYFVQWREFKPISGRVVNEDAHHITFADGSYYYYNSNFSRYGRDWHGNAIYIYPDRGTGWVETKQIDTPRRYLSFVGDEGRERVVKEFLAEVGGIGCAAFKEMMRQPRSFAH